MQQNKNKILAIFLGVLLLISMGLFFVGRDDAKPEFDRDQFKVVDSEKIDEVKVSSSNKDIVIRFENGQWMVNGKWPADMSMIKVLFATLRQAEPSRPVAAAVKDSVRQWLERYGTHIEMLEGGVSKVDFFAGGNSLKTEAWFLQKDEQQPYVMIIPGYHVYVAGVLELDESGWRNKRIFDFNWRNFKSLTSRYPREPGQDFEVEMKQRYFGIKEMAAVDTAKLNSYLDAVSLLFASRFVDDHAPAVDGMESSSVVARIEIRDIADRSYSLELFAPKKESNEVYGRLRDGQVVVLEKDKVAEVVRRKDYFSVP